MPPYNNVLEADEMDALTELANDVLQPAPAAAPVPAGPTSVSEMIVFCRRIIVRVVSAVGLAFVTHIL